MRSHTMNFGQAMKTDASALPWEADTAAEPVSDPEFTALTEATTLMDSEPVEGPLAEDAPAAPKLSSDPFRSPGGGSFAPVPPVSERPRTSSGQIPAVGGSLPGRRDSSQAPAQGRAPSLAQAGGVPSNPRGAGAGPSLASQGGRPSLGGTAPSAGAPLAEHGGRPSFPGAPVPGAPLAEHGGRASLGGAARPGTPLAEGGGRPSFGGAAARPDVPAPLDEPKTPVYPTSALPDSGSPTILEEPDMPRAARSQSLELPLEGIGVGGPKALPVPNLAAMNERPFADFGEPVVGKSDWGRWGVALTAVFLVCLAGVLFVIRGKTPRHPPEALMARDEAARLLRRDDTASLKEAAAAFEVIASQTPAFVEARALQMTALAFLVDDARFGMERLDLEAKRKEEEAEALRRLQQPADWENRVNLLVAQQSSLKGARNPAEKLLREHESALKFASAALSEVTDIPKPEVASVLRARALEATVLHTQDAEDAVKKALEASDKEPAWLAVLRAESLLSSREATAPAALDKARAEVEAQLRGDAAFIRLEMLTARLAIRTGKVDVALGALDVVLGFNPQHEQAKRLRESIRHVELAAAAAAAAGEEEEDGDAANSSSDSNPKEEAPAATP